MKVGLFWEAECLINYDVVTNGDRTIFIPVPYVDGSGKYLINRDVHQVAMILNSNTIGGSFHLYLFNSGISIYEQQT